jgi:hypothetical protein
MTEIIIGILKDLGIYTEARAKFPSDEDLATCFDDDFDELVLMFT